MPSRDPFGDAESRRWLQIFTMSVLVAGLTASLALSAGTLVALIGLVLMLGVEAAAVLVLRNRQRRHYKAGTSEGIYDWPAGLWFADYRGDYRARRPRNESALLLGRLTLATDHATWRPSRTISRGADPVRYGAEAFIEVRERWGVGQIRDVILREVGRATRFRVWWAVEFAETARSLGWNVDER